VITAGKIKYAQLCDVLERNGYTDERRDALLFVLDFEIFRQTGRAVTAAPYVAAPYAAANPWPTISWTWQTWRRDFVATQYQYRHHGVVTRQYQYRFDFASFTRRELRVFGRLIDTFRWTPARDLPQPGDVIRDPWAQICLASIPAGDPVPYTLVLDDRPDSVSLDCAEARAEEAAWAAVLFQQEASDAAL
jgi:hypothetical protein